MFKIDQLLQSFTQSGQFLRVRLAKEEPAYDETDTVRLYTRYTLVLEPGDRKPEPSE